ncbi:hypothetical protein GCM10009425_21860 [Pseudomonas asuensis]|uniref:Uncharacterized protein n=1 Tax=Pseudomonas asuensis TaxID=1825787 RepID=A0ABQ2GS01_9PSED|nr:hypothetical protein GCM10009425_21860 [Pseudomonas asuensis]
MKIHFHPVGRKRRGQSKGPACGSGLQAGVIMPIAVRAGYAVKQSPTAQWQVNPELRAPTC